MLETVTTFGLDAFRSVSGIGRRVADPTTDKGYTKRCDRMFDWGIKGGDKTIARFFEKRVEM